MSYFKINIFIMQLICAHIRNSGKYRPVPVIPANWEAEAGGSLESSLDNIVS